MSTLSKYRVASAADCVWRPASEPPLRDGDYLGHYPVPDDPVWIVVFKDGKWYAADGYPELPELTHWTPLPAPPTSTGRGSRRALSSARGRGRCACGRGDCEGCGNRGRGHIGPAARRALPESEFALPLSMASAAVKARIEKEWPGADGGYPMDTMRRTANARSRAVSQLNAGYITPKDAQTILDRTYTRTQAMQGRRGWRPLKPLTLVQTRRGWRSAPVRSRTARRAAANRGRAATSFYEPGLRYLGR